MSGRGCPGGAGAAPGGATGQPCLRDLGPGTPQKRARGCRADAPAPTWKPVAQMRCPRPGGDGRMASGPPGAATPPREGSTDV